jgi:DASS family divalent anion:Na+ symporter
MRRAIVLTGVMALWFTPVPAGLTPHAWQLFALFAGAIAAAVVNALPILTASVLARSAAVLSGTLPAAAA